MVLALCLMHFEEKHTCPVQGKGVFLDLQGSSK